MGNGVSLKRCTKPEDDDKFAVAPYLPTIAEEGSVFSDQSSRTGRRVILPPKVRKNQKRTPSQDEMSSGSSLFDPVYGGRMPVLAPGEKRITFWTPVVDSSSGSTTSSEAWVQFPPFKAFNNSHGYTNNTYPEEEKKEEPNYHYHQNHAYGNGTTNSSGPKSILKRDDKLTPVIEEGDSWTLFRPTMEDNTTSSIAESTLFDGVDDNPNDDGGLSLMELSAAFFSVVHQDTDTVETAVKTGYNKPSLNDRSGAVFKYLEKESRRGNKDEVVNFLETAAIVADLLLGQHKLRQYQTSNEQLISQKAMKSDGDASAMTAASDKSTVISKLLDEAIKEKRQVQGYSEPTAGVQNIFDDLTEVDTRAISEFYTAVTHILKDVKSGDPRAVSERSAMFFRTLDSVSTAAAGQRSDGWDFSKSKGFTHSKVTVEPQTPRPSEEEATPEPEPQNVQKDKRRWWSFRRTSPQGVDQTSSNTQPKSSPKTRKGTIVNPRSIQVTTNGGDKFDDDDYELTIQVGNKTRRTRGEGLLMWFCCVRVDLILKRIASSQVSDNSITP